MDNLAVHHRTLNDKDPARLQNYAGSAAGNPSLATSWQLRVGQELPSQSRHEL